MKSFFKRHRKIPLFFTVMIFTALFGLFGCASGQKKTVTSVESMQLVLHGMRGGRVYKIEVKGEKTVLTRYREVYRDGEDSLEPEASAQTDTASFIDLMNSCGVIGWNRFHGKHPKNVHDGEMFHFSACVNGGTTIKADGSANFPKGYHEFVSSLNKMLAHRESV